MSKTLEELGYEKDLEFKDLVRYTKNIKGTDYYIRFYIDKKVIEAHGVKYGETYTVELTMEELKAIYQYCIDNKWI